MNDKTKTANFLYQIIEGAAPLVWSWGIKDYKAIPNGTKGAEGGGLFFRVNGYKYSGAVTIIYMEGYDLFNVNYLGDTDQWDAKPVHVQERLFTEDLIDTLDDYIEYTGADYEERVKASYPSLYKAIHGEDKADSYKAPNKKRKRKE